MSYTRKEAKILFDYHRKHGRKAGRQISIDEYVQKEEANEPHVEAVYEEMRYRRSLGKGTLASLASNIHSAVAYLAIIYPENMEKYIAAGAAIALLNGNDCFREYMKRIS